MPPAFRRRPLDSGFAWSVLAGAVLAGLAVLTAYATAQLPLLGPLVEDLGLGSLVFPGLAGLAGFLLAGPSWWLLVERPGRVSRQRGALVGLLTGLLAHPLTWTLAVAYVDLQAGRAPFADGVFSFVALFLHFGLAITGTYTVFVGVCGGLAVTLLRERTSPDAGNDRSNLFMVAVLYVGVGLLIVVIALATSVFFPALVGAGLLAAGASALVLRHLPVVRTFLQGSIRGLTASVASGLSPRQHVALGFGFELGFVLGGIAAYALASPVDNFYWYPVAFLAVTLPAAIAANYRRNGWKPARSARRAVLEWTVYLGVIAVALTAAFSFYLRVVLSGW